jgi:hypothetical protein
MINISKHNGTICERSSLYIAQIWDDLLHSIGGEPEGGLLQHFAKKDVAGLRPDLSNSLYEKARFLAALCKNTKSIDISLAIDSLLESK